MLRRVAFLACFVLCLAACGGASEESKPVSTTSSSSTSSAADVSDTTPTTLVASPAQPCADVVDASYTATGDGFRFDVTVRSGDTGWDKYADAWVVRTVGGVILGERVLLHPHETEQPFTRSLSGVAVPDDSDEVVIAARDSVNGYCGERLTLAITR